MATVLVVADVFVLRAVVGLVPLLLLLIKLESAASTVFFLRYFHFSRIFDIFFFPHLTAAVRADLHHLSAPRELEDLLFPVEDLLDVTRPTTRPIIRA